MGKPLEELLEIEPRLIKQVLEELNEWYPGIELLPPEERARKLCEWLTPHVEARSPEDLEQHVQAGSWILPRHTLGFLGHVGYLRDLIGVRWGNCLALVCLYRILARHLGLDDEQKRTRCRICFLPQADHAAIFLWINGKKHLADPTYGIFDNEPRATFEKIGRIYKEAEEADDEEVARVVEKWK